MPNQTLVFELLLKLKFQNLFKMSNAKILGKKRSELHMDLYKYSLNLNINPKCHKMHKLMSHLKLFGFFTYQAVKDRIDFYT